MTLVAVAPGTRARGFDGVREKVPEVYEVLELREALQRDYTSDAHLVTYVVRGAKRQSRINKAGLPHFPHPVEVGVFFADVDNESHAPWTDEMLAAALEDYDTLDVFETAGVYHTAGGRRIVQPLAEPIPVQEVEPYLHRWHVELERAGIRVDKACRDWTRHFRLPNVVREGRWYRSPFIHIDQMRPIPVPPLPEPSAWEAPALGTGSRRPAPTPVPVPAIDWSTEIPSFWHERVETIAAAVREVRTEWHTLFLAIAGALLSRGVSPEHVPALCRAISLATGADTRVEDRDAGARSTVQRWLAGQPATGYTQLATRWPGVAAAVDEVTATGLDARMRALARAPVPEVTRSIEETTATLEETIRSAPPGVTLIAAECGLGKTRAAIRVAAERAAKPYATDDATGQRAPPQSKTSISVDKNALAKQIQRDPGFAGAGVRRLFGPLSVMRADGTPECRYYEVAEPLVAGGQSMQRELCEGRGRFRCEHYDECEARRGFEGPEDARVTAAHHALIAALDKAAGTTGVLVIDEPPDLLVTTSIRLEDVELTEATLSAFDPDYVAAMRPALQAVRTWIQSPTAGHGSTVFKEAVRLHAQIVDPAILDEAQLAAETEGDAVECAANAPLLDERSKAPPLRQVELMRVRHSADRARRLGAASGVLGSIHNAVIAPWLVIGRVQEEVGQPVLQITAARRELTEALRREGAVVVMDANIGIHADIYEKALGYKPPLHRFHALDGAPVARTRLWCSEASRTHWMRNRKLVPKPSLINAIREIVRWVKEDPSTKTVGLITLMPIRLALDLVLHPEDSAAAAAWKGSGQLDGTLEKLCRSLGPVFASWDGEVVLGHYGGIRGLDTMKDVDCLVTLGDPWPNVGQVERDTEYLGMPEQAEARKEALCRAELEQAHGRLRTVHRTRPGRALHVGRSLPDGSGWCGGKVEFRYLKKGRPGAAEPMSIEELEAIVEEHGSVSAAARAAGCSRSYLQQLRAGKRPISQAISDSLRRPAGCKQTP